MSAVTDKAEVKVPPPLFLIGPLGVGLGLHMAFPLDLTSLGVPQAIGGGVLALLGLAFSLTAAWGLIRRRTDLIHTGATTAVLVNGPFRISRNPIYAGALVTYVGVAVAANSIAALALFPVAFLLMRYAAIGPEERYLEAKFGEEYRGYSSRVRRWL